MPLHINGAGGAARVDALPRKGGLMKGSIGVETDNAYDIGQPAKRFKTGYFTDIDVTNPVASADPTKVLKAGDTMSGNLNMGANTLTAGYLDAPSLNGVGVTTQSPNQLQLNVGATTVSANQSDLTWQGFPMATENYVDTADDLKLSLAGGTMGGDIDMNIRKLRNVEAPVLDADATNKFYVDSADGLKLDKTGGTLTGQLLTQNVIPTDSGTYQLGTSLKKYSDVRSTNGTIDELTMNFGTVNNPPTFGTDIPNKTYVDTADGLKVSKTGDSMTGTLNNTGTFICTNATATTAVGEGAVIVTGGISTGNSLHAGGNIFAGPGNTVNCGTFLQWKFSGADTNCRLTRVDGNRPSFSNAVNPITLFVSGANVNNTTPGQINFGTGASPFQSGIMSYFYTGSSDISLPGQGANLNLIQFSHLGRPAALNIKGDSTVEAPNGGMTAKQSWMEAWWSHTALNSTGDATNTTPTILPDPLAGVSFYFPAAGLPTRGINNLVPVLMTVMPRFDANGPLGFAEWIQSFIGNRMRYTYGGTAARRFKMTVNAVYDSSSGTDFNAFQAIIKKTVGGVFSVVNGSTGGWRHKDAGFLLPGISTKIFRIQPGDEFEVAVGQDPLQPTVGAKTLLVRDMTVCFVAMLNQT